VHVLDTRLLHPRRKPGRQWVIIFDLDGFHSHCPFTAASWVKLVISY